MPIPALIVSGWLGSGKTTLVGRLLDEARARGVRLAIVSNEFGDTGINRALLDAGEDGFVELDGGCVCCRLSDALGDTVAMIIEKARPDRLILETSGVAYPGEVLVNFWRPPIEGLVSDVSVVVVVDAERYVAGDHGGSEPDALFDEQVEAADRILLNKCDLIDEPRLAAAEAALGAQTGKPVQRTVRCEVGLDEVFPGGSSPRRDVESGHDEHDHAAFDSFERRFDGVVDEDQLIGALRAEDAVRCKGFVTTRDGVRVVQGVGQRIELTAPIVPVRPELLGRVVVIRKVG